MNVLETLLEEKKFIQILHETYHLYFKYGPRSPKKVDYFHLQIKNMLLPYFSDSKGYIIKLEYDVKSCNSSGKKKCDIVILRNNVPYIIIPVKVIMSNYQQNKNNSWENITGELIHIKWANPDIIIIPINMFIDKTPYLQSDRRIKKFENVKTSDIQNYDELINHNICNDVLNYIAEVEHTKKQEEYFDEIAGIRRFHSKYRTISSIFTPYIT